MSDGRVTSAGQTTGAAPTTLAPSDHEAITKAARGIPDTADSTVSFDAGTRTFTIAPVSGAFSYYIAGRRYTVSAAKSIVIANTSGTHWIYYDGATLSETIDPDHDTARDLIVNKVRVGLIYWNATDGAEHLSGDERHGPEMPGATQAWKHALFGMVWHTGLDISGYTLDTDTDAGVSFELTDGVVHDEDLEHDIVDGAVATHYAQQLSGGNAEVPILHRDGVDGSWTADAATDLPWKLIAPNQRLAYNNHVGGGVYGQTEVSANKWVNAFLYVTNDWKYPVKMIQGQNEHASKQAAVEAVDAEIIALGDLPSPEMVLLYGFSLQTNDPFGGTNNCKIVAVTDFRQRSRSGGLAAPPQPHSILSATHADSVAAAVTAGAIIYGNATQEWAKHPLVTLNTAGAMSGLTQLNVDNLRFDGNTISTTGAGSLILNPELDGGVRTLLSGSPAGLDYAWSVENDAWHASMTDTRTALGFFQAYGSQGFLAEAARIVAGTETDWTPTASTQDAYLAFFTGLNGTATEKVRINALGQVGIGTTDPAGRSSGNLMLDIRREGNGLRSGIGLYTHENTTANRGSTFFGARSRGTNATPVIVNNGDRLFAFVSQGFDGNVFRSSANIIFAVDSAPSAGVMPTEITFWTGNPTASTRLTIQSDGDILVDSGTSVFVRDSALGFNSSVDGQLDLFADVELEITAPTIDLTAATAVFVRSVHGIGYGTGAIADMDLITVQVPGAPRQWWDESENAFAMTHRLILPEGVQTKYATDDVADPPTDAELDAAFGDPTVVGSGFVGVLDDNDAGTDCYVCWTTGAAGEWFYAKGIKAV